MATYFILNIIFMSVTLLILRVKLRMPSKPWWLTLLILLIMTAVFDALIIGAGIVDYDRSKLLGLYVGNVPVEDFMYAILAVMILPTLWRRMEKKT